MTDRKRGLFELAVPLYRGRGWPGVLPLHDRAGNRTKSPPPGGFTGYGAPDPTDQDIARWTDPEHIAHNANIGLRLPETVIGLDVDAYDGKQGGRTFEECQGRLGELPATWTSTSRDDGSGIRFYRVPPGRAWADTLGAGVEIVHHGHRYAVVSPSIHPQTRKFYEWYSPEGHRSKTPPRLGDLPELPEAWVTELDRGPAADRHRAKAAGADEGREFLDALPPGPPCQVIEECVQETVAAIGSGGSRHDAMRNGVLALLGYATRGHRGGREGLETIRDTFGEAVNDRATSGEWDRAVLGAIGKLTLEAPATWRCCDDQPPPAEEWFWTSRERLKALRDYARASKASPWGVLGATLAVVAAQISPKLVLPPLGGVELARSKRGGIGSLNLFVGLVGPPGAGKDLCLEVAEAFLWLDDEDLRVVKLGTGQGIAAQYTRQRTKAEGGGLVQFNDTCLFSVREVDNLAAHAQMGGATLLAELKTAYMGSELGEGYAKLENRRPVRKHQYRMALVCNIQPSHAGAILADVDGGLPQRWLWFLVNDPNRPKGQELSGDLLTADWRVPPDLRVQGDCGAAGVAPIHPEDRVVVEVCQSAREEGEAIRERSLDLEGTGPDNLDGHSNLARLKVAALLSVFDDRRGDISEEDWKLAEVVMAHSRMARRICERAVSEKAREVNRERGRAEGIRRAVAEDTVAEVVDQAVTRAGQNVLKKLDQAGGEWVTASALRKSLKSNIRRHFERVVEGLAVAGAIEAERYEHNGQPAVRYRRAAVSK